jgi:hypothetical protein
MDWYSHSREWHHDYRRLLEPIGLTVRFIIAKSAKGKEGCSRSVREEKRMVMIATMGARVSTRQALRVYGRERLTRRKFKSAM